MKKLFILGLSLVICVSLTGCNVSAITKSKIGNNKSTKINDTKTPKISEFIAKDVKFYIDYGEYKNVKLTPTKEKEKKIIKNENGEGFSFTDYDLDLIDIFSIDYIFENNSDTKITRYMRCNISLYDQNDNKIFSDYKYLLNSPPLHPHANCNGTMPLQINTNNLSHNIRISKIYIEIE